MNATSTDTDHLVDQLARVLDPDAYAPDRPGETFGVVGRRPLRRMAAEAAAARAVEAGWRP